MLYGPSMWPIWESWAHFYSPAQITPTISWEANETQRNATHRTHFWAFFIKTCVVDVIIDQWGLESNLLLDPNNNVGSGTSAERSFC